MSDLVDKVLIVTGTSRGIGAAAAAAAAAAASLFAEQGATVVLAARDEQALAAVAADIAWDDREAHFVPTDVTDISAVERLVTATVDRYGRLDGAFNNAGDGHLPSPLAEIDPATFDRTLDVNPARRLFSVSALNSRSLPRAGRSST